MGLVDTIDAFDGKLTEPLKVAVAEFDDEDAGLLVELCHSESAVAATWVVKGLLEAQGGASLDLRRFFAALQNKADWLALLHLLQCVQFAPDAAVAEVFAVRGLLRHSKTFVRVWALDAFVRIALVEPEFLVDARARVAAAQKSEFASVRARANALGRLLADFAE